MVSPSWICTCARSNLGTETCAVLPTTRQCKDAEQIHGCVCGRDIPGTVAFKYKIVGETPPLQVACTYILLKVPKHGSWKRWSDGTNWQEADPIQRDSTTSTVNTSGVSKWITKFCSSKLTWALGMACRVDAIVTTSSHRKPKTGKIYASDQTTWSHWFTWYNHRCSCTKKLKWTPDQMQQRNDPILAVWWRHIPSADCAHTGPPNFCQATAASPLTVFKVADKDLNTVQHQKFKLWN